jgi:hypothetical protein
VIEFSVKGEKFAIPEPVGERALALYSLAVGVCERAGVLDTFLAAASGGEREEARAFGRAAIKLAGDPAALVSAKSTLLGGTVDGELLTEAVFVAHFSLPGRFLTPYVASLMVWMRAGFFAAPSTSASAPKAP